ncbi:hypothetical protein XIS1_1680038 [Xenorhabdus innexi]|uniref:Uncharacterized protein n=1 Tax=Xenorhabdus innexi TaxID=290109 RepID=A0A1N6MVF0_9GAMM|nr:hypothetical protein XIS1_1680038 [Xenorhabdus innexi]
MKSKVKSRMSRSDELTAALFSIIFDAITMQDKGIITFTIALLIEKNSLFASGKLNLNIKLLFFC